MLRVKRAIDSPRRDRGQKYCRRLRYSTENPRNYMRESSSDPFHHSQLISSHTGGAFFSSTVVLIDLTRASGTGGLRAPC